MVLEATVICLDNSEWMRNGDYMPSRFEAQQDAVNLIGAAKTQSNPESTVSVMTMAQSKNGIRAEVLVTLTQDLGKILSSVHLLKIGGEVDFSAAMQVAQLVLKHRQNKNQHQRIIAFVGSPIQESTDDLVKLAKKLKKNNIAVDIVNFGEEAQNSEKLEAFISAVNNNEESHLVTVPPGPHILSDILLSSPIVAGDGGGFGAAAAASAAAAAVVAASGGAPGGGFEFGVDPNMDPELAMAIRLSIEEERARQEAEARRAQEQGQQQAPQPEAGGAPAAQPAAQTQDVEMASADEELMAALEMSMAAGGGGGSGGAVSMDLSEDEQIQLALQMSMGGGGSGNKPTGQTGANQDVSAALQDPDFLNSVLTSLPGVDPNDERIKSIVSELKGEKEKEKEKDEKKEKK